MSDKIDYLDEDPVISSQKYCVVSVLTPKNFKFDAVKANNEEYFDELVENLDESDPNYKLLKEIAVLKTENQKLRTKLKSIDDEKKVTMYTFKVRGSYETVEEAQKRIALLNALDKNVNIYLAEVGKWCPFEDDPEKAKDAVYKDEELNRLMKGYKENQEKGKQLFEQRKAELVSKALQDTKDKKDKNKLDDEKIKALKELSQKIDSENKPKIEDTLAEKENELKQREEKNKEEKKEIEGKKTEIKSKEDKIRKLNDEVAAAKKRYEEMLAKSAKNK